MNPKTKVEFAGKEFIFFYDIDKLLGGSAWDRVAQWCVDHVSPEVAFVDIGAHIGFMSVLTGKIKQPREMILIEPDERACGILRDNLKMNGIGKYTIIQKAAMDHEGSCDLFLNLDNSATTSIRERGDIKNKQKVSIPCFAIDDLNLKGPIVMKIDAEFAEPLIWRGMKKTMPEIRAICMEYDEAGLREYAKIDPKTFLQEIKDDGFSFTFMDNNNLEIVR